MKESLTVISQTKKWITDVVVGCNFCPFAAKEIKRNSIHYEICIADNLQQSLEYFLLACQQLDNDETIETSLLIFPESFTDFDDYLELVELTEKLLKQQNYEGIYQVASFHPQYIFAGSNNNDPANYTNRSPYPMLHLLREKSIAAVLEKYNDPEQIPERNILYAHKKGLAFMQQLFQSCL